MSETRFYSNSSTNVQIALALATRGWPVLPVCWPTSGPDGRVVCGCGQGHTGRDIGKAPVGWLAPHGHHDATTDQATIHRWWADAPRANVGIALGPAGLVAIDCDNDQALAEAQRRGLPATVLRLSRAPAYIYRRPADCPAGRRTPAPGLDILGDGYLVVWGQHPAGCDIRLEPWPPEPAAAPDWVVQILKEAAARRARRRTTAGEPVEGAADVPPPVRLEGPGLALWRGELVAVKGAEGLHPRAQVRSEDVDRSRTLWHLALHLARAGAAGHTIAAALAERDRALGFQKYADRGDEVIRYEEIVAKIVEAAGEKETHPPTGPYFERAGCVYWSKPTRDGPTEVLLANFSARITAEVILDDGADEVREFEIEAVLSGRSSRFRVPAAQFAGLAWVYDKLGPRAVVQPGTTIKDHLRAAIQTLSFDPQTRRVFTHLGWRQVDGRPVFLHTGGGLGPDGPVSAVEVEAPRELARFRLPDPPEGEALRTAVKAALGLLDLAEARITAPLLGAAVLPPILEADFSIHLAGPTGVFKTELAALAQRFYGPELDGRHLPAGWHSTANALEFLAFRAKDALLVVDDFAPAGPVWMVALQHREADRLLRAAGNRLGRRRLRADATPGAYRPPRCLILSTGEDIPRGQSLRARVWVVEVAPGDVNVVALTRCQEAAAAGLYAQALAAYVRWLAGRLETVRAEAVAEARRLRDQARRAPHPRTPDIAGKLGAALGIFLRFAQEAGVITETEVNELWARMWAGILAGMRTQADEQAAQDPARRFIELLVAAITSGEAHIADPEGEAPRPDPRPWGWRLVEVGTGENVREEWRPQGLRVGWVEGDDLYLEPDAALKAARRVGDAVGDPLAVGAKTLHKRLAERSYLRSTEEPGRLLVRKTLEGARRRVLHMGSELLFRDITEQKSGQSGQSDQSDHKPATVGVPDGRVREVIT